MIGRITARFAFNDRLSGTWSSKHTAAACTNDIVPPRPTGDANGFTPRSDASDFAVFVGLDHVAGLEVLVVLEADTALEALTHLTHVVLEAPQRSDRALPDDRALAEEPDLRPTGDDTARDVATGDATDTRHAEHLAHLGVARDDLFELGLEHADERVVDVFEDVVDDLVQTQLDALALGEITCVAVGTNVEADHRRVRDDREVDVGLADAADAAVHERQAHFVVLLVELAQRVGECFEGALGVGLHDEVQRGDLAALHH